MTGSRPPDLAWEALVRETHANPAMERGKLNAALKAIREAAFTEGIHEDSLPQEIQLRADAYRAMWPMLTLTPTALARHWFRVVAGRPDQRSEAQRRLDELKGEKNAK